MWIFYPSKNKRSVQWVKDSNGEDGQNDRREGEQKSKGVELKQSMKGPRGRENFRRLEVYS